MTKWQISSPGSLVMATCRAMMEMMTALIVDDAVSAQPSREHSDQPCVADDHNRTEDFAMDHTNHTRLTSDEYTEAVLNGATVYGPGDEKIGSISHTHGTGADTKVVIDVGGFLGIGAKPVLVSAQELDLMRDESGGVHALTTWTKDALKSMPKHED